MDYNQTKPNLADRYVVVKPEHFAETIAGMTNSFDAVISSHNLEHCDDRWKTLAAMIQALKSKGRLYLAFPTEKSVSFPNRIGTLNYYDDPTHKDTPPDYDEVIKTLKNANMTIQFASRSYKPFVLCVKGFFDEPLSKKQNKVFYSTWCYYGFEAIIWARKR
jgi:SAM-dependent methyltransferase